MLVGLQVSCSPNVWLPRLLASNMLGLGYCRRPTERTNDFEKLATRILMYPCMPVKNGSNFESLPHIGRVFI